MKFISTIILLTLISCNNSDLEIIKIPIDKTTIPKGIVVNPKNNDIYISSLHLDQLVRYNEIQNKTERMYGFKPVVIEDCAHALGSEFDGKKIGSHGNICTFSFQAIKHLTSVDGGLLIVPHKELFDRGKLLRWYGIDRENTSRKDFRCEGDIKEWG